MADRIAIMKDGRIVQIGRPDELYCAPADPFVASFFGEVNVLAARVRDGQVATPFGPQPAPGLEEGRACEVVIRPEALHLSPAADGIAEVIAARMLGRSSLVHLRVQGLHLHARMPGRFLPAEGDRLAVALDHAQAYVFPVTAANW